MDRRKFIKFAGIIGATQTLLNNLKPGVAQAQTWQKLGASTSVTSKVKLPLQYGRIKNAIAAGYQHTVAIRSDGMVFTAGINSNGQLGINSVISTRTFIQAIGVSNIIAVTAASSYHTLAIGSDGSVFSAGNNLNSQLGDNSTLGRSTFVRAVGISNAISVAAGASNSVALRADGWLYTAGNNTKGQLGSNLNTTVSRSTFAQAIGVSNVVAIAMGGGSCVLALRADGYIFSTGDNGNGQLGANIANTVSRSTFVQAVGVSNVTAIAAGNAFSLALRADGAVYAAGSNAQGQLGNNSTVSRSTFAQIVGISNIIAIAGAGTHSVLLYADGSIYTSGGNILGQLGVNTAANRSTFTKAIGVSNAVAVAASGGGHTIAIRSDGLIFACGYGAQGQIGENAAVQRSTFVQTGGV